MSNPTRFPNGLSTNTNQQTLGYYGLPDPTKWHTFFTDFDQYTASDWTVTLVGAGGTAALTAVDGGNLLITTDVLDNDSVEVQKTPAAFTPASGKRTFFKTRFKVSDATQSDVNIGVSVIDTTLTTAGGGSSSQTDGFYFFKADGSTSIAAFARKNATTGSLTQAAVATLVSDTFITLGLAFDGVKFTSVFVNEVKVFQLDMLSGTTPLITNFMPDTILAPHMAFMNGEAGAETMTVDYIFVAQER